VNPKRGFSATLWGTFGATGLLAFAGAIYRERWGLAIFMLLLAIGPLIFAWRAGRARNI
jgi:hypothetical protein